MPHQFGWYLIAEYESGFRLIEDEQDHSPYDAGRNVFHAIINGRPSAAGHGRMTALTLAPVAGGEAYRIDWTKLWELDDPRPIYFREMSKELRMDGTEGPTVCDRHVFGYQYVDAEGRNQQVTEELPG